MEVVPEVDAAVGCGVDCWTCASATRANSVVAAAKGMSFLMFFIGCVGWFFWLLFQVKITRAIIG